MEMLDPGDLRVILPVFPVEVIGEAAVVGSAGHHPRGRADLEVRHRNPERGSDGQLRQRLRLDTLDIVGHEAEAVAHIHDGRRDAAADLAREDEAGGQGLADADAEPVDLELRLRRRDHRADLEHVGLQDRRTRAGEVQGIVLEEGTAFREALAHEPDRAVERGGLPVPFRAEAVAFFHQALRRKARNLVEAHPGDLDVDIAQVVEIRREALRAAVDEQRAERQLRLRGVPDRLAAVVEEDLRGIINRIVLGHERVHVGVLDLLEILQDIAERHIIDVVAQAHLRLDLVCLDY